MCVRALWPQGPLKNPSVTHFCVPKNTPFSLFLVLQFFILHFYHLFLLIPTLLPYWDINPIAYDEDAALLRLAAQTVHEVLAEAVSKG